MKILCAYSGLEYQVQHIPSYLQGTGEVHPVFSIPQKKLFSLLPKWVGHELTDTDSYLLYLALFNSTGLIRWNCPAKRTTDTASIVAKNMEHLVSVVGKMNIISSPRLALPQFLIGQETRTLENTRYWIHIWDAGVTEFLNGLKNDELRSKLSRREAALERFIKNPSIQPQKYARLLADWTAEAGQFPLSLTPNPLAPPGQVQSITICDYWKEIIQRCYNNDAIISVPERDIQELLEYCEDNIEAGSIFSFHLFNTLREGQDRHKNYLGIGLETSASSPGFRILDPETSIQDATLQLLIDTAPKEEPKKQNYPTLFAYIKAKLKWDTAQKYMIDKDKDQDQKGNGESDVV